MILSDIHDDICSVTAIFGERLCVHWAHLAFETGFHIAIAFYNKLFASSHGLAPFLL
jgi:hypothetical protein